MKAPPRLAPAVLREVEHDPVDVLEFLFGVDAGIIGHSSASRLIAGAAGFFTLIQWSVRPET
jgi:hypothetical protein